MLFEDGRVTGVRRAVDRDRGLSSSVRMIALYRPGSSILHRTPAGPKLAALAIGALVLSLYPHDAVSIAISLAAVLALYGIGGMPIRVPLLEIWRLRWIIVVLARRSGSSSRLSRRGVGTGTRRDDSPAREPVDAHDPDGGSRGGAAGHPAPFQRWGVDPDAISLTISLTITTIPCGSPASRSTCGMRREPATCGWVVRAVVPPARSRHSDNADDVGDALAARGLG